MIISSLSDLRYYLEADYSRIDHNAFRGGVLEIPTDQSFYKDFVLDEDMPVSSKQGEMFLVAICVGSSHI